MINGYLRKRENLVQVFVLIDSRHTPQKNDLEFVNQLDHWGVKFSLVFTKTDKEKPAVVERNVKAFLDTLRETWLFLLLKYETIGWIFCFDAVPERGKPGRQGLFFCIGQGSIFMNDGI